MTWREVWNRRAMPERRDSGLQDLIDLDGFDTGAGRVGESDWRQYAGSVATLLGLSEGSSVYEVGCGAGAFLFALRERFAIRVGGSDYSPSLIDAGRRALPGGSFDVGEAEELPAEPAYDFVVSNGVFHYFPDLSYAARVIGRMIAKCNRAVAVLEVPDEELRTEAENLRREKLSPEVYERKYAGLPHLYYRRDWFRVIAASRQLECRIFPSPIPNSAQSGFRFGAILSKL